MLIDRPERFSPVARHARTAPRWLAVAEAEWTLRLRNTNSPVVAAMAAAACILLTPSADANYAVITFGGMKPALSAGTTLAAAGVVLSLLAFPVWLLTLGLGCARDRRLGTGELMASLPVPPSTLAKGRVLANVALVAALGLAALCLTALAAASRFGSLPDPVSAAAFLLVVIPSGLCAVPVAALLDRYLGDRDGAKAAAALSAWLALAICAVLAIPDVFGLDLLRRNAPAGIPAGDFSVGIVFAENMRKAPWPVTALAGSFVLNRLLLATAAFIGAWFVWIHAGMKAALSRAFRTDKGSSAAVPHTVVPPPRVRPKRIGATAAGWIVARRWLAGAKWTILALIASLAAALIVPQSPRIAAALALLVPLSIANRRRISGDVHVRRLEQSTSALWRPAPLLFNSLVLAALAAAPLLPLAGSLPAARTAHLLAGVAAAALWLTWTCGALSRPLLGISVYSLFWYLEVFCDLPRRADLFGLAATSVPSFAAALAIAAALSILVRGREPYAFRSSGNV